MSPTNVGGKSISSSTNALGAVMRSASAGRFKEKWSEEYREQLGFFSLASADQVLKELTLKLKKRKPRLPGNSASFDLLEPVEVEHFGFSVRSKAMQQLISLARHVARVDMSVVVMGESGVGKERIARFIHEHSTRR